MASDALLAGTSVFAGGAILAAAWRIWAGGYFSRLGRTADSDPCLRVSQPNFATSTPGFETYTWRDVRVASSVEEIIAGPFEWLGGFDEGPQFRFNAVLESYFGRPLDKPERVWTFNAYGAHLEGNSDTLTIFDPGFMPEGLVALLDRATKVQIEVGGRYVPEFEALLIQYLSGTVEGNEILFASHQPDRYEISPNGGYQLFVPLPMTPRTHVGSSEAI